MEDAEATTRFVYDVLWVVGRYLNACIMASSAARQGDPGARTPCSFQFIIAKLDPGRYAGRQLPASLQGLLSVRARRQALAAPSTPSPAPQTRYEPADGNDSQGRRGALVAPRGRRREDRSGESIANPRPIQSLCLLPGENTRGMYREVALPTLGGVTFCNRWHLGYAFFGDFPRAASHVHPPVAVVDEVAAEMTAERAAELVPTAQA